MRRCICGAKWCVARRMCSFMGIFDMERTHVEVVAGTERTDLVVDEWGPEQIGAIMDSLNAPHRNVRIRMATPLWRGIS